MDYGERLSVLEALEKYFDIKNKIKLDEKKLPKKTFELLKKWKEETND